MNTSDKTILVTGATGRQGGAVTRHLLNDGWKVRALTRDPTKESARRLAEMGVELIQGDLNKITGEHRAFKDLYGIFSVQDAWEAGVEAEVKQGKRLADIGRQIGVQHFVYTSVGGAERKTKIPHFDSKWQIEEHIRELKLPHTIVRPVFFMDNFLSEDFQRSILEGKLSMPMRPDKPLQMIAVDDIGGFTALIFRNPEEYLGKAIELAGDELTMPQVAQKFGEVLGRNVAFVEVSLDEVRKSSPETAAMFDWFNKYGYEANIAALKQIHPELLTFDEWLHKSGWSRHVQEASVGSGI